MSLLGSNLAMRNALFILITGVSLIGCNLKSSDLSSKNKSDSDKSERLPAIAREVNALTKEDGSLLCSGMDQKMNLIRTRASFTKGKLDSLSVAAYANKSDPSKPPNDLTPDLKKFEVFSHELIGKALDIDLDLDGKKFGIEVVAEMNGKARKVYELDMRIGDDGEGEKLLNSYLSYKNTTIDIDLSEVYMACSVFLKN